MLFQKGGGGKYLEVLVNKMFEESVCRTKVLSRNSKRGRETFKMVAPFPRYEAKLLVYGCGTDPLPILYVGNGIGSKILLVAYSYLHYEAH